MFQQHKVKEAIDIYAQLLSNGNIHALEKLLFLAKELTLDSKLCEMAWTPAKKWLEVLFQISSKDTQYTILNYLKSLGNFKNNQGKIILFEAIPMHSVCRKMMPKQQNDESLDHQLTSQIKRIVLLQKKKKCIIF